MRKLGLLFLLGNVMWFAACGGSGGGSSVTSVNVSCVPSTVSSGGTSQCSAIVAGTGNFNSAVTWSTNGGTISSSGVLTAPTVTSQTVVTVTATSVQNTSVSGAATVTVTVSTAGTNVAPVIVDAGPQPATFTSANVAFITVTVCVPGTNTCQNIDHVQVDTGSEGLRLLSTASGGELNLTLPQETVGGNPLDECLVFADGYVWGPVNTADVTITGTSETASGVPLQVLIPSSSSPAVPTTCSNQAPPGGNGNEGGTVMAFGANGLIGVGLFQNDCGNYCAQQGASCNGTTSMPCVYYQCPSGGCAATNVPNSQQVPNPVLGFATDNNGVLIQLPSLAGSNNQGVNVSGSLVFGINTESNNNLTLAANVYAVPDTSNITANIAGDLITTYNGQTYNQSFLDSGSNGLYFLNTNLTSIPTCSPPPASNTGFYCPTSAVMITATNQGQNASGQPTGNSGSADFTIENALTLFNSNGGNNTAFSTLGGPYFGDCGTGTNADCEFDFGLPFFYGKNVFTAIDGASVTGGPTGPFFAY